MKIVNILELCSFLLLGFLIGIIMQKRWTINHAEIDYIIFGQDTVMIKGARVIDFDKLRGRVIDGHNDTANHIFITTIK